MIQNTKIVSAIETTLRNDRGRMLAALGSYLNDYTLAEDALQDAMTAALKHWYKDIPDSPRGWLLQVAKRKALDMLRKSKRQQDHLNDLGHLVDLQPDDPNDIPDDRLRLIFTCCHPALERNAQVALTLRALGGLTTDQIARAFVVKPATMGQRISRAKAKIEMAKIPYMMPDRQDMHDRLDAVLEVIYLIYNEGYSATEGDHQLRIDLCEEALFLARLLVQFTEGAPEACGLLALILFSHARRFSRMEDDGGFIPLSKQNRNLWDQELIAQGQAQLEGALPKGQVGPYQLQAAIHGTHCAATRYVDTDWAGITALYGLLLRITGSLVVRLNYAVAVSYAETPERALAILDGLMSDMTDYTNATELTRFHAAPNILGF